MSSKKTILVGIDYSPHSKNALREAARMANAKDLSLVCFHVLDQDVLGQFKHLEAYTEKGVLNFAHEKLDSFIRDVIGTAYETKSVVSIGHLFKETLKRIEEHQPETLVLGSRGFSTTEHHHVGTLASRCVRKAPVEVLLVRSFQDRPFQKIVACVDFSDTSRRAIHRAAELACQNDAGLLLLHVYQPPIYADSETGWLGPAFPISPIPNIEKSLQLRLEELGDGLGKEYDLQNLSTKVISALRIHHGIRETLEEEKADLVVLGTRGRTGFKKLLLGTTAEGLIHNTPCSALTIKPEDFHYSLD
ncbi:MAG: universal stress protein E [Paracoccaceae bacterium]|jgi:universal stress protein E